MLPIKIEKLSKKYSGKRGRVVNALKSVDLSVVEGEVFGFLGPNGAGKSTTIKTLMGQIKPTSGKALLLGHESQEIEARRKVGYLPENPSFYDFLTAMEYLHLVGRMFKMNERFIKVESERVLELLQLTEAMKRPIRGYSKGMVQRLGLAQALMHDPDLYILDEPMSGLDPVGRALVKQIMRELKERGKTVFFSTHVIADVEEVCDRVAIITAGTLRAVYNLEDVLREGIVGYSLHVSGCSAEAIATYRPVSRENGLWAVSIAKDDFKAFTETVHSCGGQVDFIEAQRSSLESLFLEVVNRAS